jgi:hypothetical protein
MARTPLESEDSEDASVCVKRGACDENDATDVRSVVLERSSVGCLCHADALVRLSDFLAKEAPRRNTVIVLCSLLSICSQPMIDLFST